MLVMMVLMIAAFLVAGNVSSALDFASARMGNQAARAAAGAGIEDALCQLKANWNWSAGFSTKSLPTTGYTYAVTVTNNVGGKSGVVAADGTTVPPGCVYLVSVGHAGGYHRTVALFCRSGQPLYRPFTFAVFGTSVASSAVAFTNGGVVDALGSASAVSSGSSASVSAMPGPAVARGAVGANGSVLLSGGAIARGGVYAAGNVTVDGGLVNGSVVANTLTLQGGATVAGNVRAVTLDNPGGTITGTATAHTFSNSGGVSGSQDQEVVATLPVLLAPPVDATYRTSNSNTSISSSFLPPTASSTAVSETADRTDGQDGTTSSGTSPDLTIGDGQKVSVSAGTYYFHNVVISGSGRFTVANGPVVLYVSGAITTSEDGGFVNSTGVASNFQIYSSDTATIATTGAPAISLSTGDSLSAVIYCPQGDVTLSGSSFVGAIVAASFTDSGGTPIHYDPALGNLTGTLGQTSSSTSAIVLSWDAH